MNHLPEVSATLCQWMTNCTPFGLAVGFCCRPFREASQWPGYTLPRNYKNLLFAGSLYYISILGLTIRTYNKLGYVSFSCPHGQPCSPSQRKVRASTQLRQRHARPRREQGFAWGVGLGSAKEGLDRQTLSSHREFSIPC